MNDYKISQGKNILNNFKDVLGRYCVVNQFIELSKRCFESEHKGDIENRSSFIALADQYSITITNYDTKNISNNIARCYIVNVHLCFETFLKQACVQVKKYGKVKFKEKSQNESWLECAVKNIFDDKPTGDIKRLCDLCEYYRLVRNSTVHDLCDDEKRFKEYNKLHGYEFEIDAKYGKLSAPNRYDFISFDDFILFARVCEKLATCLYENIIYDYEKIILDIPESIKSVCRKYTEDRCKSVVLKYIETHFRVDNTLNESIHGLVNSVRNGSIVQR